MVQMSQKDALQTLFSRAHSSQTIFQPRLMTSGHFPKPGTSP
ncbi:hypothetical protein CGRA01v4_04687 [Colletotrichum graminicola]|nr:hypothetical protein CGRA01v4_04687 [Colletotrichum graminicola]